MSFFKRIFEPKSNQDKRPLPRIRISSDNIKAFPKIEALLRVGEVKFDSAGRLRYLHGAPVGDMILIRVNNDGTSVYEESAEEWFDPNSQKAKDFAWE